MKYRANPVIVDAFKIKDIEPISISSAFNTRELILENHKPVIATASMLERITPKIGDYLVIREDGYVYLNPKEDFECKYSPVTE